MFFDTARDAFQFLESEYGCKAADSDRSGNWLSLTYANESTAICISWEVYDELMMLYVIPLQDRTIPPYSSWLTMERLLEYAVPQSGIKGNESGKKARDLEPDTVIRALEEYAELLHTYGKEALRGNFPTPPTDY